ncbi:MAG TPA: aminoglycoside phosphotransferase family protein [Dongiaceae bacterium]|nr:aminoglycoside phosphotransferase family protein [Dongiaceae bacterium]
MPTDYTAPAFDPVRLVIERTNCVPASIICKPLAGGYLNQVFRLIGPFGDWVVKKFKLSSELTLFPNLARAEARALGILGPLGIAPRLIEFIDDPDHGMILIYAFHAGAIWPGPSAAEVDVPSLAAVAALLKRQHQLTVDGFRDVPVTPTDILAQGDQFLAQLERAQELHRLRPVPADHPVLLRRSLLHTDVGPGNLIVGPQGLRLIDWQCPALGDAAEDLCAFLSPAFQILYGRQPLTPAQRAAFLFAYDDRRVSDRLQLLEPFFHWRMAAYCSMRQQQYAAGRPEAASAYAKALAALIKVLGG